MATHISAYRTASPRSPASESEFSGTWTMAHVLSAAREATAGDDDRYRAEFVELVEAVVRSELLAAR